MQFTWRALRMISPMMLMMMLTGCAQFDKVWHNREYNYLRKPVSQHAPLKTPPGIESIQAHPKYILPAGPDHYAETDKKFDMAPPDLDKLYTPSELKKFKSLQGQATTHLQPLPATKTGLLNRIEQLKAELHSHQSNTNQSTVAPAATKANTQQTRQQKLKALKQQLSTVQHQLNILHHQSASASSVPPSKATAKPPPVSASVAKLGQQPLPALSSDLSRNDAHQAVLMVGAPFKTTWLKVGRSLSKMGYSVRDTEKTDGVYFIAPTDKKAIGHTIVLSIQPQDGRHTKVQVYNTQGALATSQQAYQLLHQLQQHLKAS